MEMLGHTTTEAKRLGLGVDMTTGTGWPFGGPQVAPEMASAGLKSIRHEATGGTRVTLKLPAGKLECLRAFPESGPPLDLTGEAAQGTLDWLPPAGKWTVIGLASPAPIQKVKRAAPGGAGNVVDPFSAAAMSLYLERFDAAFGKFAAPLPRAQFHDVLLYFPIHDLWHNDAEKLPLFTVHNQNEWLWPTPFHQTSMELWNHGIGFAYASDRMLAQDRSGAHDRRRAALRPPQSCGRSSLFYRESQWQNLRRHPAACGSFPKRRHPRPVEPDFQHGSRPAGFRHRLPARARPIHRHPHLQRAPNRGDTLEKTSRNPAGHGHRRPVENRVHRRRRHPSRPRAECPSRVMDDAPRCREFLRHRPLQRLLRSHWSRPLSGRSGQGANTARLFLNEKALGISWCEPHVIDIGAALKPGSNLLEIEVTNLAANRIADLDRRKIRWKRFHEINFVNIDYKPFDAATWPVMDSGLSGPARLLR